MSKVSRMKLKRLFEPGQIGQMKLKNRIIMPAMATNFGSEDGTVSQRTMDYYEARARGGAGLIIVENACVENILGRNEILPRQLLIDDDKYIPGLSRLAEVIHKAGARAALQFNHAGREAGPVRPDLQPVAPSPVARSSALFFSRSGGKVPRELPVDEIQALVKRYAEAVERARKAGFDGVEILAAHGYLIAQFLSAAANKRHDRYGGTVENRARFLVEIIRAVRDKVGRDYPFWCRINGQEFFGVEGGITPAEAQQIAKLAEAAGCDAIHVSSWGTGPEKLPPMGVPVGHIAWLAAEVKKAVKIPVIAVGHITPEFGEGLLQEGKADFVAIGRALIADPDLPNKAKAGKNEDIRPCLSCSNCSQSLRGYCSPDQSMICTVNAAAGKESESAIHRASRAKKVLVIGGGPAGLEAASVAASRGHAVTLYEKRTEPGGKLLLAAKPPHKGAIKTFSDYLVTQARKQGVKVELGKQFTEELNARIKPDVIIVATGAVPCRPPIAGMDRENVVMAEDVLAGAPVGKRVVVIGGGLVGAETAEFLAEKGAKVTIVEMLDTLAAGVSPAASGLLLDRLKSMGVAMFASTKACEATAEGLVVASRDGEQRTIEADTIVLAAGAKPDAGLYSSLKGKVPEIHLVGDCMEPRTIVEAIREGFAVGSSI